MISRARSAGKAPLCSVEFAKECGAHYHAAFHRAVEVRPGVMQISFPTHDRGLLQSRRAQMQWAQDKARHLRSWHKSNPRIIEHGGTV